MEQPDSTIESIQTFAGTVHTYRLDEYSSFARGTKGPDPSDNTTPLSIEVTGGGPHKPDMQVEVGKDGERGLRAHSGKIAAFCYKQDTVSDVTIESDFDWPSTRDVLGSTKERQPDNTLLNAAYELARSKACGKESRTPAEQQKWNRILAIYDGDKLTPAEIGRLETDKVSLASVRLRLIQVNRSLEYDQYDDGAQAVVAVGPELVNRQILVDFAD